ncbi:MAG TPA: FAD/NAD(P)-binding oxidoreductase [Actinomycetota bacterium]|nr:FAD/NAD(P)-binding oxidoreductase [Actinomycetota bacterium]
MARVVVLGGGFGGLAAAVELRSLLPDGHEVVLVDRRDGFFMGFAKLWDLAGTRPLAQGTRPLANLARRGVRVLRAEVLALDPGRRTVSTSEGDLTADGMVVALGASFDPEQVASLRPPAFNLYDPKALGPAREALRALDGGRVVVTVLGVPYKCPPAPYEAAFLLDQWLRDEGRRPRVELSVSTPQPMVLPVAGPEASARVAVALEERGVAVGTGRAVSGLDPGSGTVRFADGSVERFDLLLGVPRHVASPVLAAAGFLGPSGWVEPDPRTLRTAFERVYAVGDCTAVPAGQGQLPKAGVFAEAQGRVAARNLVAELTGGPGAEFDGRGACFLEVGGGQAAVIEGEFFAPGGPAVRLSEPDEATLRAKAAFERERLEAWLPER